MLMKGHRLPDDPHTRDSALISAMKRRPAIFRKTDQRGYWTLIEDTKHPANLRTPLVFDEEDDDPV